MFSLDFLPLTRATPALCQKLAGQALQVNPQPPEVFILLTFASPSRRRNAASLRREL
jgi:hypothetical protein